MLAILYFGVMEFGSRGVELWHTPLDAMTDNELQFCVSTLPIHTVEFRYYEPKLMDGILR